jgi:hypothetical protein
VADIDGIGAVSLTIDGTVVTSGFTLSGSITSRTFTYTGHLAAGTHTYEINASDSTGLAATPVSGTFVVKATAPVISSVRKQVGTDVTATIITWMVNDIDGVGTVKLTIDGIDVTGIVKSGTSTSAVFTYTAVLSAGTHSYAITAYDSTGLAGKLAKGSFKVKSAMFASTMATGVTAGTAKTDWLVDYSFAGSSSVNANSVDAVFAAS